MQQFSDLFDSHLRARVVVGASLALAACGGIDVGPKEKEFLPATLVVLDGANQQVVAGSSLPRPIKARAERDGVPILNGLIWFRWSQPQAFQPIGGAVSTDASGVASYNFTTFSVTGPYTVTIEYKECTDTFPIKGCENYKTLATTSVSGTIVAAGGG